MCLANVVNMQGEEVDVEVPDFVTRIDVSKLTDPQLDELIEKIRLRRMMSVAIYQQTQADIAAAGEEKAKVRLEKKLEQIDKVIETLDRNFEKLETYIAQVRGLRIQAGLTIL